MNAQPGNSPLFRSAAFLIVGLGAAMFLLPFFWMLSTSLKPLNETMTIPPQLWPSSPQWRNYPETIARMGNFGLYLFNTLWIACLSVVGSVFSSALAAYGFSRMDWKRREKVFLLVVCSMMLPFAVTVVPLYGLFRGLDWIGTPKPLWVPAFFAPLRSVPSAG